MGNEAKWNANLKKVAYLKTFPGWLSSWEQCIGSTIKQVIAIPDQETHSVLLLSQGKFVVTPQTDTEPQIVTAGLLAARAQLEPTHPEAFQHYDHLTQLDQEAGRVARLENILNAIDNNLERIPELKTHIRKLVSHWDNESSHSS